MKSKTVALIAIGVIVVAAGGVGVFAYGRVGQAASPAYLTETVRVGNVEQTVSAVGALQPFEMVDVGSVVSGQLVQLNVKLGDRVRAGQVLAQVDARQLQNQLRDRESQLAGQQANVLQFTSNVENAQRNLARQQTLKDAGFASGVQYDQATNNLRGAQAGLSNFEGQVKTAEIAVQGAKEALSRATILAPIDGVVAEVVARPGQILNANQSTPLILRIAKMDKMTVRTRVSEADIVNVLPGQKAYFTLVGDPSVRYYATLRMKEVKPSGAGLDPTGVIGLDSAKDAIFYNALFEVPNTTGDLFPAMTADVRVVLGEAKGVLTVPLAALGPSDATGRRSVRVLGKDGNVESRQVVTGLADQTLAEVKSGLAAGEKVVIERAAAAPEAKKPLLSGIMPPT